VVLSNGATLDLQASIADSASDVSSVTYTVHVPKGTYVVSVLNTDGVLGLAEHIQVYSDSWPGSYTSTTLVSTRAPGVAVTAYATVVSALDIALGSKSVSGSAGETLSITITSLL
jgi:hypothetical protein